MPQSSKTHPEYLSTRAGRTRRIFQVGFNKCGTRSISAFLDNNGIPTVHFKRGNLARALANNLKYGYAPLNGIDRWVGYTDMQMVSGSRVIEGCRYFRQLAAYYPNSYFILNTRDKDRWIASRRNHGNGFYAERYRKGMNFESVDQVIDHWSEEWDRHHQEVPEFFKDQPDKLLIYNIETDSPDQMSKFLAPDFETDPTFFGHEGKTSGGNDADEAVSPN